MLALLNTTPVVNGQPQDDLADPDAAREWLESRGGTATEGERDLVLRARALLQDVVRGEAGAHDLQPLLEGVSEVPRLEADGRVTWHLQAPADQKLAALAVLSWSRLADQLPGRLRPCGNAECRLFFVDRSKAQTGRWCSMAICGNRMKARRHQARAREQST